MKKCPFCAEEIQDDAIKCKHCGEWLAPRTDPAQPVKKENRLDWGKIVYRSLMVGLILSGGGVASRMISYSVDEPYGFGGYVNDLAFRCISPFVIFTPMSILFMWVWHKSKPVFWSMVAVCALIVACSVTWMNTGMRNLVFSPTETPWPTYPPDPYKLVLFAKMGCTNVRTTVYDTPNGDSIKELDPGMCFMLRRTTLLEDWIDIGEGWVHTYTLTVYNPTQTHATFEANITATAKAKYR